MKSSTDQLGRTIACPEKPQRIISLVPSQTELLFDLGLDKEVIGITKFCVHPAHWHEAKTKVGGTKNLQIKTIRDLRPDLIIANKEENNKSEIDDLMQDYPIWISDVRSLESGLEMIRSIGQLTTKMQMAELLIKQIEEAFYRLSVSAILSEMAMRRLRTAYLIWHNPLMAVGGDNFIHDMMQKCGLLNIFEGNSRYPTISLMELKERGCQLLILSTEPFPFSEKFLPAFREAIPDTHIIIADGEMFSWYGSRMKISASYFTDLLQRIR